jgi:predicted esterase
MIERAVGCLLVASALVPAQSKAEPTKHTFGSSYYLLDAPGGRKKEVRGLIVMLHGSGGRPEHYVPCYHDAVAKGWVVCLPASIDPQQYDSRDETQVIEMVEDVLSKHPIDRDRILLSGHSAGAAISFFLVSKRPDLFTACAAGAAGLRFPAERLREASHVPFYIATGAKDFNLQECERSRQPLEDVGIRVMFRSEPNQDHSLAPAAWTAMFAWCDALVPPDQAKVLQGARAAIDHRAWGKAATALAKLQATKSTTEHVQKRAALLLAAIDRAADAELAEIREWIGDGKLTEAVLRLEKAKVGFAGAKAAARIAEELAARRLELGKPK